MNNKCQGESCNYRSSKCKPWYYVSINGDQISWKGPFCCIEEEIEEPSYILGYIEDWN